MVIWATEKKNKSLEFMIVNTLGELRFSKIAITKLTSFKRWESEHLTNKPSLKYLSWTNVLKQKHLSLDDNESELNAIAQPQHLNLEERSDLVYEPTSKK